MMIEEVIGSLGHRFFAFHVDEPRIVFVLVAVLFTPNFLGVRRTSLKGFAFIIAKVLICVNSGIHTILMRQTCSMSSGTLTIARFEEAESGNAVA